MAETNAQRPNILIIVADDLGFTDPGCFGGEIKTPNIDRLGEDGVRFSNFHVAPSCAPTRSMLMTGTTAHLAGIGVIPEFLPTFKEYQGQKSYRGHLSDDVVILPELLRDAGYYNVMSGKWHLGTTKDQSPYARGFEKSFSLLVGGGNHYGWEPQLEADDLKYKSLMFHNSVMGMYIRDDDWVTKLPKDYYSTTYFADTLIEYLKDQPKDDDRPFFAYLPFQAPHFPLQAPQEYIRNYRGRYDAGPEAIREERLARMKQNGLIPEETEPADFVTYPQRKANRAWEKRDKVGRERSARKMEVFAGMVECMDANIGKVIDHLESTGQLDNTMIFFMSDNGAEGAQLEAAPLHSVHSPAFSKYFDNSLDNLGNHNSYCWYGNRWAQVGTTPSRLYKFFTHEGGIRVCSFVRFPKWKRQGVISHEYCTVMDILPTILDSIKYPHPGEEYKGHEVQKPLGKSWLRYMQGEDDYIHTEDTVTGWESIGRQALRKGNYKIVLLPPPWGSGEWEMYDLAKDRSESSNIQMEMPEKFQELLAHWKVYARENRIVENATTVTKYYKYTEEDLTDGEPEGVF